MTGRWREFIEDDDGRGSSTRLSMVYGIAVGSFVVVWLTVHATLSNDIFLTFMLASGGVYGFGKWRESLVQQEQIKADSPNPPPVIVPPVAAPGPTTVIQVGPGKPEAVKDLNVKAEGDLNVTTLGENR
ncbi:hypothetical protein TA3x_000486 [Tundrisphaera sp. TA3]|uniref:hypothetical protein n=1 Tax=Tundrisphaera sp. TA3 TaxID=3435775 RepID=UPI003EB91E6A